MHDKGREILAYKSICSPLRPPALRRVDPAPIETSRCRRGSWWAIPHLREQATGAALNLARICRLVIRPDAGQSESALPRIAPCYRAASAEANGDWSLVPFAILSEAVILSGAKDLNRSKGW